MAASMRLSLVVDGKVSQEWTWAADSRFQWQSPPWDHPLVNADGDKLIGIDCTPVLIDADGRVK